MTSKGEHQGTTYLKPVLKFFSRFSRQFIRAVVFAGLLLIVVHHWFPHVLFWLNPHVVGALALAIFGFLLDQVLEIRSILITPPMKLHDTYTEACNHLEALVRERGAKKIDLIQFSGQTALRFLKDVAAANRAVKVRLLLMHPDTAKSFDADEMENQLARIATTVGDIRKLCKEHPLFSAETYFYRTCPGIDGILVDDQVVSVGWYRCFLEGDTKSVLRVRSHSLPAITATGEMAVPLRKMVRDQFDALMKFKETTEGWRLGKGN